jgi:tRNA dimethylallyltransferase
MPREALHARIEARVRSQLAAGLVEEVRALLAAGVPPQAASMQGVGYKEMVGVARGIEDLDTAVAALLRNTRRYAKRQYTWFRAEPRVAWIDVANEAPAATAADIAARLRAAGFAR